MTPPNDAPMPDETVTVTEILCPCGASHRYAGKKSAYLGPDYTRSPRLPAAKAEAQRALDDLKLCRRDYAYDPLLGRKLRPHLDLLIALLERE